MKDCGTCKATRTQKKCLRCLGYVKGKLTKPPWEPADDKATIQMPAFWWEKQRCQKAR